MVKETSKKSTTKKTPTKKTTTAKKTTKKVQAKPVIKDELIETKVEVKKIKKENKFIKVLKKIGGALKKFFNDPRPIITVLCIICALLIWSFANYKSKYKILIGSVTKGDITISNVQIDMNPKVNSFISSVASYNGDDVKVYSYELGYYYKAKGEFYKFAGSSNELDTAIDLGKLLSQASYIQVFEMAQNETNFTKDVKAHIDDLYFVVRASTEKDSSKYDINYEIKIDFVNMNE